MQWEGRRCMRWCEGCLVISCKTSLVSAASVLHSHLSPRTLVGPTCRIFFSLWEEAEYYGWVSNLNAFLVQTEMCLASSWQDCQVLKAGTVYLLRLLILSNYSLIRLFLIWTKVLPVLHFCLQAKYLYSTCVETKLIILELCHLLVTKRKEFMENYSNISYSKASKKQCCTEVVSHLVALWSVYSVDCGRNSNHIHYIFNNIKLNIYGFQTVGQNKKATNICQLMLWEIQINIFHNSLKIYCPNQ